MPQTMLSVILRRFGCECTSSKQARSVACDEGVNQCNPVRLCLISMPVDVLCSHLFPFLKLHDVARLDSALCCRELRNHFHEGFCGASSLTPIGLEEFQWLTRRKVSGRKLTFTSRCALSMNNFFRADFQSVQELKLRRGGAIETEVLATLLTNCPNLATLTLHVPRFQWQKIKINADLNLTKIDMRWNHTITDAFMMELLTHCPQLRVLMLGSGELTTRTLHTVAIYCPNLQELSCSYLTGGHDENPFNDYESAMRHVVHGCPQLTHLEANVTSQHGYFCASMACKTTLIHVQLAGGMSWDQESQDDAIILLVENCCNIQHLELHDLYFCPDTALFAMAQHLQHLRTLQLREFHIITDAGVSAVRDGCKKLTTLGLYQSRLLDFTCLSSGPTGTLEHLSINCALITKSKLVSCVQHNPSLRTLEINLSRNFDNDYEVDEVLPTSIFSSAVQYLPNLTKFYFKPYRQKNQRCLNDQLMGNLALYCKQLTVLEIAEGEYITSKGFAAIATLVHLTELVLESCAQLDDSALCAIAVGCSKLEQINIRAEHSEKITNVGMYALAQHCRKMKYVTICGCGSVSDDGVLELLRSLPNLEHVMATGIDALSQGVKDKLKRLQRSFMERAGD